MTAMTYIRTERQAPHGAQADLGGPMLFAVLVVSGVALALSACGGEGGSAQQEINARRQSLSGKLLTVYRTLFTEVPGKVTSRKLLCRILHSLGPTRADKALHAPVKHRSRHYMYRRCIDMRRADQRFHDRRCQPHYMRSKCSATVGQEPQVEVVLA
jgi:hypothetical protein